jgi:hypothetical protein
MEVGRSEGLFYGEDARHRGLSERLKGSLPRSAGEWPCDPVSPLEWVPNEDELRSVGWPRMAHVRASGDRLRSGRAPWRRRHAYQRTGGSLILNLKGIARRYVADTLAGLSSTPRSALW